MPQQVCVGIDVGSELRNFFFFFFFFSYVEYIYGLLVHIWAVQSCDQGLTLTDPQNVPLTVAVRPESNSLHASFGLTSAFGLDPGRKAHGLPLTAATKERTPVSRSGRGQPH